MTPRPRALGEQSTVLNIRIGTAAVAAMKDVQMRDGVPVSEQVRRGIQLWLDSRGVVKSDRKRALTRKRP